MRVGVDKEARLHEGRYHGCYQDAVSATGEKHFDTRVGLEIADGPTNEQCAILCHGKKFYARRAGSECWCSNFLLEQLRVAETDCNQECQANNRQRCGGSNHISVFEANDPQVTVRKFAPTKIYVYPVLPEVPNDKADSDPACGDQWGPPTYNCNAGSTCSGDSMYDMSCSDCSVAGCSQCSVDEKDPSKSIDNWRSYSRRRTYWTDLKRYKETYFDNLSLTSSYDVPQAAGVENVDTGAVAHKDGHGRIHQCCATEIRGKELQAQWSGTVRMALTSQDSSVLPVDTPMFESSSVAQESGLRVHSANNVLRKWPEIDPAIRIGGLSLSGADSRRGACIAQNEYSGSSHDAGSFPKMNHALESSMGLDDLHECGQTLHKGSLVKLEYFAMIAKNQICRNGQIGIISLYM